MKSPLLLISILITALAVSGHARAQSICARQKDPAACLKKFGVPEGAQPDVVIIGRIEKDRWTFEHGLKPQPGQAEARFCRYRGDLTLRKGIAASTNGRCRRSGSTRWRWTAPTRQ